MESNSAQETGKKATTTTEEKTAKSSSYKDAELPTETSPYLDYDDIEDYKRKGYGTEGHLEPVQRNAAGSTDAPTLTGADVPLSTTAHASTQPSINKRF